MNKTSKFFLVVSILILLLSAVITWAIAQDDSPNVYACVHKEVGTLRIVDEEEDCRISEYELKWNTDGPPGPQGEQGIQGEQGPPGGQIGEYSFICGACNLEGIQLPGEDLPGAWLRWAGLTEANLANANLSSSNLYNARLGSADLTGANLSFADLTRAWLESSNLSGTNFGDATLDWVYLNNSQINSQTVLPPKWQLVWDILNTSAPVGGWNLEGADLSRANLSSANLNGANLRYSTLLEVNLCAVDLRYADLTGAVVTFDTEYPSSFAILGETICVDGNYSEVYNQDVYQCLIPD